MYVKRLSGRHANPKPLNRYSYVLIILLRYTHPTGRCGVSARRLALFDNGVWCISRAGQP